VKLFYQDVVQLLSEAKADEAKQTEDGKVTEGCLALTIAEQVEFVKKLNKDTHNSSACLLETFK
jgi:hypothetical protein